MALQALKPGIDCCLLPQRLAKLLPDKLLPDKLDSPPQRSQQRLVWSLQRPVQARQVQHPHFRLRQQPPRPLLALRQPPFVLARLPPQLRPLLRPQVQATYLRRQALLRFPLAPRQQLLHLLLLPSCG